MTSRAALAFREPARLASPQPATPLVSFVIPTYNEEADIARTLGALVQMDYPRLEIIVVDDSDDRTPDIVRRYEQRGVTLVRPAIRRGRCAARNIGIWRATGDIVVLLNADVFPDRDFVRRLVRHYQGGADFLLVQSRVANEDAAFARYIEAVHRYSYDLSDMLWTEGFSCRRQAAIEAGLFPDGFPLPLTAGEDGWFGRALASRFRKAVDPAIIVPHVAPASLGAFWRERVSRGRATPVNKHYLAGRSVARIAAESLLKSIRAVVLVGTLLPPFIRASRLVRHSVRRRADIVPFAAATAIEWVGQVVGEWQSLGRLWHVRR